MNPIEFNLKYTMPAHLSRKWKDLIKENRADVIHNMAAAIVAINERERRLTTEQVREKIEQADALINEAKELLRNPDTWAKALNAMSKGEARDMLRANEELIAKENLKDVINRAWKIRYAQRRQ